MNNRICSKCGVSESEDNFHPNPIQYKCNACCKKYPIDLSVNKYSEYNFFEYHLKQVDDEIRARKTIRKVVDKTTGEAYYWEVQPGFESYV